MEVPHRGSLGASSRPPPNGCRPLGGSTLTDPLGAPHLRPQFGARLEAAPRWPQRALMERVHPHPQGESATLARQSRRLHP
eukprot:9471971-Alexandrium_andersonii.AAC.1